MEYVLETNGLSKKYANRYAVENVSIHIKKGDIYGLIGKNGAGKTTLMRMITSLSIPTEGSIKLFGAQAIQKSLLRTGCIIENPALYTSMTATQNMEYYRKILGIVDKSSVQRLLDLVGLSEAGKKKIRNYSLGMKQRLGIAIALLGNPDFLVLDEPINGLDPTGIAEVRNLLLRLKNEQGLTILISSHILGELSKMATCYGIIHDGRLVEEFTAAQLEQKCKRCLKIEVDDEKRAVVILEKEFQITQYDIPEAGVVRLFEHIEESSLINRALTQGGILVESISAAGEDLESYFMGRMGGN